jgi:hypothetical protein
MYGNIFSVFATCPISEKNFGKKELLQPVRTHHKFLLLAVDGIPKMGGALTIQIDIRGSEY